MSKTVTNSQMGAIIANLKEVLRKNHWSQRDLAERMGKSPSTISHHMRGKRNMAVKTAREYAKLLGMDYQDFVSHPKFSSGKETGISPHAYEEPKPEKESKCKPTKQHSVPSVPDWCSSKKETEEKKPDPGLSESAFPFADMTLNQLQNFETRNAKKENRPPRKLEIRLTDSEEPEKREQPKEPAVSKPENPEEPRPEETGKVTEPVESKDSVTISVTIHGMESLKELLALLPRNFLNFQK